MILGTEHVDRGRRRLLVVSTTTLGLVGIGVAAAPFFASWQPSAHARALAAPVEVDLSNLGQEEMMVATWRDKPIYILHRSARMLHTLTKHNASLRDPRSDDPDQQPAYAKNLFRSIEPIYLVVIGLCTHQGCGLVNRVQIENPEIGAAHTDGFTCPCHGSKYDLSGRVFKDALAQANLKVPPYRFLPDRKRLLIGIDPSDA